jgi:hypothetical protein
VVTADLAQLFAGPEAGKSFAVHATIGLSDPKAFGEVLEVLARVPTLAEVAKRGEGQRWEIPIPDWKPLHVGIVGDQLFMSTDGTFHSRLGDPSRQGFLSKLDEAQRAIQGASRTSFVWGLHTALPGAIFLTGGTARAEPAPEAAPAWAATHAKLWEDLSKVRKDLREWSKTREERGTKRAKQATELLGSTVASGRIEGGALVLEVAQITTAKSAGELADRLAGLHRERKAEFEGQDGLWDQALKLEADARMVEALSANGLALPPVAPIPAPALPAPGP